MIEEKIKIYVSAEVETILNKDTENFEFFKKDGRTPNRNALLSRLIIHYSERFQKMKQSRIDYLKQKLKEDTSLSDTAVQKLSAEISEKMQEMTTASTDTKFDRAISIKPTKASAPVIFFIEAKCLLGASLSEHFRNMFTFYAGLPQDQREQIIFQDEYHTLMSAIGHGKKVFLSLSGTSFEAMPYAISRSKEEMHLYLLYSSGKGCSSVKLSRINAVTELADDADFDETQLQIFSKMREYGPQYAYRPQEEEAIVELTADGIKRFQKMYVHRPVPTKIEGNRYFFSCSYAQLTQYFVRFDDDAYIVSPISLRDAVIRFHRRALRQYQK